MKLNAFKRILNAGIFDISSTNFSGLAKRLRSPSYSNTAFKSVSEGHMEIKEPTNLGYSIFISHVFNALAINEAGNLIRPRTISILLNFSGGSI